MDRGFDCPAMRNLYRCLKYRPRDISPCGLDLWRLGYHFAESWDSRICIEKWERIELKTCVEWERRND
jgi:hypothetical protein